MKSYSLDNSLCESIFREDLFLYNWLQLVFSETFCAFVLPHCVDPVPDPHRRERESDMAQLIATFDRFGSGFMGKLGGLHI